MGARLAANALAQVYGLNVPHLSPRYASAAASVSGATISVTVSFLPETVVDGLIVVPGAICPTELGVIYEECAWPSILVDTNVGTRLNATATGDAGG